VAFYPEVFAEGFHPSSHDQIVVLVPVLFEQLCDGGSVDFAGGCSGDRGSAVQKRVASPCHIPPCHLQSIIFSRLSSSELHHSKPKNTSPCLIHPDSVSPPSSHNLSIMSALSRPNTQFYVLAASRILRFFGQNRFFPITLLEAQTYVACPRQTRLDICTL